MGSRIYNQFYTWLWQDDFLTGWPKLIDSKDLSWLNTWYWVTLWPKVNKLFYSNSALRNIYIKPLRRDIDDSYHLAFWDDWEIYNFEFSTDNTPVYTMTTWKRVRGGFMLGNYYYFLHEDTLIASNLDLAWCTGNGGYCADLTSAVETACIGSSGFFCDMASLV